MVKKTGEIPCKCFFNEIFRPTDFVLYGQLKKTANNKGEWSQRRRLV